MRDNSREDLKKLFSIILDSEVTVRENINIDDKEIFLILKIMITTKILLICKF